jgi:hypothetical protein
MATESLTYAQIAERLGINAEAARGLVRRHHLPRSTANDGKASSARRRRHARRTGLARAYARTWASRAARAAPAWNAAAIAVTAAPLGTGGSTGKTVCAAGVCGVRTMRQASARRRFMRQKLISAVPVC